MKINFDREIVSSTEEVMKINISWNPANNDEDTLVAIATSVFELIKRYNRLNTLVGDDDE
jgi:hypothetical protein